MIVIGGMIGLGKTTLAEKLGERLGIPTYFESVKDNKILPLFYKATPEENEKYRYSFLLQLSFLQSRLKQIKQAKLDKESIMDRSIYEDLYFAKTIHDEGRISDLELAIYQEMFEELVNDYPPLPSKSPSVMIYLHGSFETVLTRIKERGRDFELDEPSLRHHRLMWEGYDKWFHSFYKYSPVIEVDCDKRACSFNKEDQDWLVEQLRPYINID